MIESEPDQIAAEPSSPAERFAQLAIPIVAVAVGLAAWALPATLTNDGPNHLLAAWMHHVDAIGQSIGTRYELAVPPTSRGFNEFTRLLLALGLDLPSAAHVAPLACVALLAAASVAFIRSQGSKVATAAALALPLCKPLCLGFYPFLIGMAFGLMALASLTALRGRSPLLRIAVCAALFFVAARCHVVAAAVCGLAAFVLEVAAAGWRGGVLAAVVGVPALIVVAQVREATRPLHAVFTATPFLERLAGLPDALLGGPLWRGGVLLALLIPAALLVVRQASTQRNLRALAALGLGLIGLGAILPRDMWGWQLAGDRSLLLGVIVCLPSLDALPRRMRAAAAAGLAVWAVTASTWFLFQGLEVQARHGATVAAALHARETDFARVPLRRAQQEPLARDYAPLFHIDHLVTIGGGGASIFGQATQANNHYLRLLGSDEAEQPEGIPEGSIDGGGPLASWEVLPLKLGLISVVKGLTFVGPEEDIRFLEEVVGYRSVYRAADLAVMSLVGCSMRVQLRGELRDAEVSLGYWPSRYPARAFDLRAGSTREQTLSVSELPCGEMWLRVEGLRCVEANDMGYVRVPAVRPGEQAAATCTVTK
jgi:hypothetical protein